MSMFARSDKGSEISEPAGKAAEVNAGTAPRGDSRAAQPRTPVPSLIGAGLKVKGNLETAGEIQVDGEVEGDVHGKSVTVGDGAVVKGSVFGDAVTVSGTVEGKVEGMTVIVQSTARLTGDIVHETVQIEKGAYVDGRCSPHFGKAAAQPALKAPAMAPHRPDEAPKAAGDAQKADKPEKAEAAGKPH